MARNAKQEHVCDWIAKRQGARERSRGYRGFLHTQFNRQLRQRKVVGSTGLLNTLPFVCESSNADFKR